MEPRRPGLARVLVRGMTRRCPQCGTSSLFTAWFRMAERCPSCGLRFEREAGFFVGALFVNFAVTEVVLAGWIVLGFVLTWPDPNLTLIAAVAIVVCVVVPLAFYPFSKTIWAALHLLMAPLDPEEEADAAAFRFERGDAGEPGSPSV